MSTLLTRLTLVTVGAVVAVLAAYLILIAAALFRANRNLEKLVGGLQAIRNNTAPLAEDVPAINGAAIVLRDRLMSVAGHLKEILRLAGASERAA